MLHGTRELRLQLELGLLIRDISDHLGVQDVITITLKGKEGGSSVRSRARLDWPLLVLKMKGIQEPRNVGSF